MLREDSHNDHDCEAFLPTFLSNEGMEEALIFIHMWRVTGLQEEDETEAEMLITHCDPFVFKVTSMYLLESTDLPVSYDPAVNILFVPLFSLKVLFRQKQLMNIWGAYWFTDHLIKKGNQSMVIFCLFI